MELAQMYFPAIAPRSAWRRMKDLLRFMPAEVSLIFNTFGMP